MVRTALRFVAGLVGFLLIIPGWWAVVGAGDMFVTPTFDVVAIWIITVLIWAACLSLLWFAFKSLKKS
jgi:hypothetical protein